MSDSRSDLDCAQLGWESHRVTYGSHLTCGGSEVVNGNGCSGKLTW